MSERVVLELPDELAKRGRELAAESARPFEEFLVQWFDHALAEPTPVALLPDQAIQSLCDSQLDASQQTELSDLLDAGRAGALSVAQRKRLDELLELYRRGLLRKAEAWRIAVKRGLRPLPN